MVYYLLFIIYYLLFLIPKPSTSITILLFISLKIIYLSALSDDVTLFVISLGTKVVYFLIFSITNSGSNLLSTFALRQNILVTKAESDVDALPFNYSNFLTKENLQETF